jgi:hypothetical protein
MNLKKEFRRMKRLCGHGRAAPTNLQLPSLLDRPEDKPFIHAKKAVLFALTAAVHPKSPTAHRKKEQVVFHLSKFDSPIRNPQLYGLRLLKMMSKNEPRG